MMITQKHSIAFKVPDEMELMRKMESKMKADNYMIRSQTTNFIIWSRVVRVMVDVSDVHFEEADYE